MRKLGAFAPDARQTPNTPIDDYIEAAFKKVEDKIWRDGTDKAPHGHPWHTSFHASQFPGDDPKACPRQAMYRLMDTPSQEPFSSSGRMVMGVGSAIEDLVAEELRLADALVFKGSGDAEWALVHDELWLTGNPDMVIPDPLTDIKRPHIIETKGKDSARIDRPSWNCS
jgi:hypothetical protein